MTFLSVADGQAWDTKGSATTVVTDIYTASASQRWIRTEPFGAVFRYQSVANPSRCLAAANRTPGAALVLVPCSLDSSQFWFSVGQQHWFDAGSGLCAKQIAIGARGLPLTQDTCAIAPLQQWRVWNHTAQRWE